MACNREREGTPASPTTESGATVSSLSISHGVVVMVEVSRRQHWPPAKHSPGRMPDAERVGRRIEGRAVQQERNARRLKLQQVVQQ